MDSQAVILSTAIIEWRDLSWLGQVPQCKALSNFRRFSGNDSWISILSIFSGSVFVSHTMGQLRLKSFCL